MKLVIASASQEALAKYIFTVNPLPNLHERDFTNKALCYYMSEGWYTGISSKIEHSVAQRTTIGGEEEAAEAGWWGK